MPSILLSRLITLFRFNHRTVGAFRIGSVHLCYKIASSDILASLDHPLRCFLIAGSFQDIFKPLNDTRHGLLNIVESRYIVVAVFAWSAFFDLSINAYIVIQYLVSVVQRVQLSLSPLASTVAAWFRR